jgi:Family of unknown function (DUF6236)
LGEAKRRRDSDPSYGHPKRGIVVCPPMEISGSSVSFRQMSLDIQELRSWVLYFDNLVWPTSSAIHIESGPEEDYLENCGVLKRPRYNGNGGAGQIMAATQIQAFLDMDAREPGRWALAQGENSLQMRDVQIQTSGGFMLELIKAIPVPNRDVPLNEVLEFKLRRFDELEVLRNELDNFIAEVGKADDKSAELKNRLLAIDQACANAIRVSHEWQFPVRLADLKANIECKPNIYAGVASFLIGNTSGLSATTNALTAVSVVAASSIPSLKIGSGVHWQGLKRKMGPYRYVYHYHRELF